MRWAQLVGGEFEGGEVTVGVKVVTVEEERGVGDLSEEGASRPKVTRFFPRIQLFCQNIY